VCIYIHIYIYIYIYIYIQHILIWIRLIGNLLGVNGIGCLRDECMCFLKSVENHVHKLYRVRQANYLFEHSHCTCNMEFIEWYITTPSQSSQFESWNLPMQKSWAYFSLFNWEDPHALVGYFFCWPTRNQKKKNTRNDFVTTLRIKIGH
jgi:hypothetical protein